jgi:hypothetical protein
MKTALVTLCLHHLPFHPHFFLGYGAAILAKRYDLEVLDLNAEYHFKNMQKLKPVLHTMDQTQTVSDTLFLYPFYENLKAYIDKFYAAIPWEGFSRVYVTTPSWFPTVPTEAVLRLSRAIRRSSPKTTVFFFGNSLGTWTDKEKLKKHGVRTVHLNSLFAMNGTAQPVNYDLLPNPTYEHREKYLFNLLPFTLKHGCSWGQCRFCSLSRGWNSGYLERSAKAAINELETVIDQYDPAVFVCRDHSLNGCNLVEFCGYLEKLDKPWCGQSRPDMSGKQIEALARAGCKGIFFGLESGSDRALRAMNKGISTKQISDFVKRLHSNGILPAPSLIIGAPWERKADFEKTIQFLMDHSCYFKVVNIYPFIATPASEFSSQSKQPEQNMLMRLIQFIRTCEDLGLKVVIGEQSIEYFLFKWVSGRDLSWEMKMKH